MKINKTFLILLSLISYGCCDGGTDCCDPETDLDIIENNLLSWFPYNLKDTVVFESNYATTKKLYVTKIEENQTSYFQGDECPDRPAEYKFINIKSSDGDTLVFETEDASSLKIKMDEIGFYILESANFEPRPLNTTTDVKYQDNKEIYKKTFPDVVIASSALGQYKTIFLAKDRGLVGFIKSDTIYEIKGR